MKSLTLRFGLAGAGVACLMWLVLAGFLALLPADNGAPPFSTGDLLLGTVIGALLFGGVAAAFGFIEDRGRRAGS